MTATTTLAERKGSECAVEVASYAPPAPERSAPARLVVATYNIRYAVGQFLISGSLLRRVGLRRPARRSSLVARNIAVAARAFSEGTRRMPPPDIIALQEADRETKRAGHHHIARELAAAMGMNYAHAAMSLPQEEEPQANRWYLNFEEQLGLGETGTTGVALLSRLPFAEVSRVDLPFADCAWRPRLALAAIFQWGEQRLFVFNAHIDPHASIADRLSQHEAIIARARTEGGDNPIVLLGDFNTLTREARRAMRDLHEAHGYTSPQSMGEATWRAGLLRLQTDWIFTRGVRVIRWGVARDLRRVSDHWPVWTEIGKQPEVGSQK